MIVSLHVATGAALGALTGSRLAALALGPPLHLVCDWVPHEDIADRRFEIRSGLFGLALLALSRGPLDPATLEAAQPPRQISSTSSPGYVRTDASSSTAAAAGTAPATSAPTSSSPSQAQSSGCF